MQSSNQLRRKQAGDYYLYTDSYGLDLAPPCERPLIFTDNGDAYTKYHDWTEDDYEATNTT